ncbi:tubulin monoglutamylase TTLL4-like [Athalia rosae]|uniref:tubulin monoglutamylase TTLL4-like n=1 Tax=Athalia rosae TaxID=37344 RepID=UPI0020346D11|nr:tubulin monoglutamylase TTLL4-like [Athalia rosae]
MIGRTVAKSGFTVRRNSENWSGAWGPPMSNVKVKTLKLFQKVNHFPGALQLSRKDCLWRNMKKMIDQFGRSEFNFTPATFVLPEDSRRLRKIFETHGGVWIAKPPAGSSGNGIHVVSKWCEIPKRCPLVVQRYISRPRLIQGVKFDMRLYALITSVHPLLVYVYSEGLVRFATSKYIRDVEHLYDRYMHLTNTSVNKTSPRFRPNDSLDKRKGNMWSLNSLWSYLASRQQADIPKLWERVKDIVIKTIISAEAKIVETSDSTLPSKYNAYQLLGFDIILDDDLNPWLLEVNNQPSMDPDTPLCSIVKGQLAKDFLNIVGFQIPDTIPAEDARYLMEKYKQSPLCLDNRLHEITLTETEKGKQDRFVNGKNRADYLRNILDTLTPDDVRHLIRYEDEATQLGGFEKIFPTRTTYDYHKFFDKPRYYNRLLDAWEEMYASDKTRGILRLQKLCEKKYHLPGSFAALDTPRDI